MNEETRMDQIVSLAKRRGFIFQGSDVYGGLSGTWDYGPLGVALKRNIMNLWWQMFVDGRDDMYGVDSAILMNQKVWQASGHVDTFVDPLCEDTVNKRRYRTDHILKDNGIDPDGMTMEQMDAVIAEKGITSPDGNPLSPSRTFNMMFRTHVGPIADDSSVSYLRPETAQGIFTNYRNIVDSFYPDLPFGIAQQGKAFRNEISPRDFVFRSREFEQMEIEYFCRPEDGLRLTDEWLEERLKFYEEIGIPREHLHIVDIPDDERAFYSQKTYDIEYEFPFGIQELEGVAYRTDYDLGVHQKGSGKSLEYFDEESKEKILPHVVEPSAGCDRTVLALICEAYDEEVVADEKGKEETRVVMRFSPRMAPVKVGVFPLLKNKPELVAKAREVQRLLTPFMTVFYDEAGAIGRRYRRQDEIGTPWCVTIDFDTLGENGETLKDTVTIRERDSMKQERIAISELRQYLLDRIA